MYTVSNAYLQQIKNKVQIFRLRGKIGHIDFTEHDILTGSFEITNQCSEQNEVKIGSVYIGELKCTVRPEIGITDWKNISITPYEGLQLKIGYEDVPLGVYTVSSAEDTEYGTDIVAYDNMSKFNKKCGVSTTQGTPYELLNLACDACKVEFGMTEKQLKAFPNGKELFGLYTENDIETWQDFVFWVAQTIAAIATMSREGKLVMRQYTQTVSDELTNHNRFSGSRFSKFSTRYSGVSVVNIANNTTNYYGTEEQDEYLTYNLGSNPFLQYGTDAKKEQLARNILSALQKIDYVPFETQVLCGALYDLGDVIKCTGGIAGIQTGCVMYYNYSYNNGYQIAGYGSDPALATARSKADKNIEGLRSSANAKDTIFYTFENAKNIVIGNNAEQPVIDIRFTSASALHVMFHAEILIDVAEAAICTVKYSLNGIETNYYPVETFSAGKHILSLMYMIPIEENSLNRWTVTLNMAGSSAGIAAGNVRAVIYGQGLVATTEWDGYITVNDKLVAVNTGSSITVSEMTSSVTIRKLDVDKNTVEATLQTIVYGNAIKPSELLDSFTISWDVETWTFDTTSEATYAGRYVNVSENVYRLADTFVNQSQNAQIDVGHMNVVHTDSDEFEHITGIEIVSEGEESIKYLIASEGNWYTIADSALAEIQLAGDTIAADDFTTYGIETVQGDLVMTLHSPSIYKWTTADVISRTSAIIAALPYPQTIQTKCDMSDISIFGIESAVATYVGSVGVRCSYDDGVSFDDEIAMEEFLNSDMTEIYDRLNTNKILTIAFVIYENAELEQFKLTFKNEEV